MNDDPPEAFIPPNPGRVFLLPPDPLTLLPLTSADLRDLADELDRLSYTTAVHGGHTHCRYDDPRLIEFRNVPGEADLVVMVAGHAPAPSPADTEAPQ